MKGIIKAFTILMAVLLAACPLALTACGSADKQAEATAEPTEAVTEAPTEAPTEEPTEEPTPEPTEPGFVPERVEDLSIFEKPLSAFCAVAVEPSFENFKAVLPGEFFDNLSVLLEDALAAEGLTIESIGYESFDDFLEASLAETGLFSGPIVETEWIQTVERADYKIIEAETAEVEYVLSMLELSFGAYLDLDKVTEAYKLNADMTIYGEGSSETENVDMYVYGYDGEYYILMG